MDVVSVLISVTTRFHIAITAGRLGFKVAVAWQRSPLLGAGEALVP